MARNQGHFLYTLDDPLIHLALAEQLAHGHYGLQPGAFAAPSSSVLWPFLLTPFVWLKLGYEAPLVLNFLAACGVLTCVFLLGERVLAESAPRWRGKWLTALVTLFPLATNLYGLCFAGMEHTLQVFLALAALWGCVRLHDENTLPRWLPLVAVLGPLVRYENLGLSLAVVAFLAWRKQGRLALVIVALVALTLGGFALFLHQHTGHYLPTSVLAKARGTTLTQRLVSNALCPEGWLLPAVTMAALALGWRHHRPGALLVAVVALGHLVGGKYDTIHRYELYAWVVGCLGLAWVSRRPLVLFVAGVLGAFYYLPASLAVPEGANNIYEQQFQLRRFVQDYWKGPVAVNDIGWITYRNPQPVLDLFGLSSEAAYRASLTEQMDVWMDRLVEESDIRLVMIYDGWFSGKPGHREPVAQLWMGKQRRLITVGCNVVTFYATHADDVPRLQALLKRFAPTLPPQAELRLAP